MNRHDTRRERIGLGILGAAFFFAGLGKFVMPFVGENFERWSYPHELRYALGIVEIVGGFLLQLPRLRLTMAAALGTVLLGAIGTHVWFGEWKDIPLPVLYLAGTIWAARTGRGERQRDLLEAQWNSELAS